MFGANQAQRGMDQIQDNVEFNPFSGNIQGLGNVQLGLGGGSFRLDPQLAAGGGMLSSVMCGLSQGGWANNQDLMGARGVGGGMTGAMNAQQGLLQQQANPFYNQANFAGNMANMNGLGNMFANQTAQGLQDYTGGRQNQAFQMGFDALGQVHACFVGFNNCRSLFFSIIKRCCLFICGWQNSLCIQPK
jgi:hypothetical protein